MGGKMLAALLALAIWFLPAAGEETQSEPMAITIAGEYAGSLAAYYDDPLRAYLEDRFNVSFVPLAADATDPSYFYRLRAAANEFPDVLLYDAQWDFLYFVQANALRPLPDIMSAYPNLRQYITYPYAQNLLYNGLIWGLPRSLYAQELRIPGYCALIRREWLDKTGMKEPQSLEDWHALLSAIHTLDEHVIPLTSKSPWAMLSFTCFYAPFSNTWIWEPSINSYVPGFYTRSYCDRISALRGLWDDGLLDPDFMDVHCGRPTGVDRFLLGQAACIVYPASVHAVMTELLRRWSQIYPEQPIEERVTALFLPCDSEGRYSESLDLNMSSIYFGASVSDKKLERILSLLDYLCSPEGLMLRRWGMEGVDYELIDGRPVSLLKNGLTLYDKYPSYSLLRVLPNLDEDAIRADASLPPFAAMLSKKLGQWEKLCVRRQRHWTSMKANIILTGSGIYFNPNLTEISFRMLTAPEGVEKSFEGVKEELVEQGIKQLIFKVMVNLR